MSKNNLPKRIAILISGRGSNMQAILQEIDHGILRGLAQPVLVFSNNPAAPGLEIAQAKEIPTQSLSSKGFKRSTFDKKVIDILEPYQPDLIVLAGYMRILSPLFIQHYPKKIINIHPADTKEHQGLGGYEWAYENQLKETKITVHYVDEGLDTGSIIQQEIVDLQGVESLEDVEKRGLAVEHKLYSKALKAIITTK